MEVQQLPSLQSALALPIQMAHCDARWAHPIPHMMQTTEGPLLRAIGGFSKLEQGALMVGSNPAITPAEAAQRAFDILAACGDLEGKLIEEMKARDKEKALRNGDPLPK
jgi:hypothetical protein